MMCHYASPSEVAYSETVLMLQLAVRKNELRRRHRCMRRVIFTSFTPRRVD